MAVRRPSLRTPQESTEGLKVTSAGLESGGRSSNGTVNLVNSERMRRRVWIWYVVPALTANRYPNEYAKCRWGWVCVGSNHGPRILQCSVGLTSEKIIFLPELPFVVWWAILIDSNILGNTPVKRWEPIALAQFQVLDLCWLSHPRL